MLLCIGVVYPLLCLEQKLNNNMTKEGNQTDLNDQQYEIRKQTRQRLFSIMLFSSTMFQCVLCLICISMWATSLLRISSLILVLLVTLLIAFIHKRMPTWILECYCTGQRVIDHVSDNAFHSVLYLFICSSLLFQRNIKHAYFSRMEYAKVIKIGISWPFNEMPNVTRR